MTDPKSPPFNRRREFQRTQIRMSAELHLGETTVTATTRDLSEGGVGIEMARPVPEGSEITLGLFLVVDDVEEERVPPLWVKGRVAWAGDLDDGRHVAGIRFEVITEAQKQWVRQVTGHLG